MLRKAISSSKSNIFKSIAQQGRARLNKDVFVGASTAALLTQPSSLLPHQFRFFSQVNFKQLAAAEDSAKSKQPPQQPIDDDDEKDVKRMKSEGEGENAKDQQQDQQKQDQQDDEQNGGSRRKSNKALEYVIWASFIGVVGGSVYFLYDEYQKGNSPVAVVENWLHVCYINIIVQLFY